MKNDYTKTPHTQGKEKKRRGWGEAARKTAPFTV